MGSVEWGLRILFPIPHSPFYCPVAETTNNALAEDAKWPAALAGAVSIFVLAARADFVEKPDTLLGLIQNLLKRVAGRRVAVLLAYLDRGALPFGQVAIVLDQLL